MILLLTLMLLVLLTFEVATISLVAQRGLGEESMLSSQSIEARRAAEVALNKIQQSLNTYLLTHTPAQATTAFASGGGSDLASAVMTTTNPGTGAIENTDTTISAWLVERRGYWFHLVGRAQVGSVDILEHRWVFLNPCNGSGNGTLSTIVSSVFYPGTRSTMVSPMDGRVFFGTQYGTGDVFWTWKNDTGLSTLVSGTYDPGYYSTAMGADGRAFFASNAGGGDSLWTWTATSGLSTIVSGVKNPGYQAIAVASDDRVYFGDQSKHFFTWQSGTGLSTIIDSPTNYTNPGQGSTVISKTDRVFFSSASATSHVWTYTPTLGLSTVTNNNQVDKNAIAVTDDDRVFFGEDLSSGSDFISWKAGTGISTILTGQQYLGVNSTGVYKAGDRVYFGSQNGSSSVFWTWLDNGTAAGVLSTLVGSSTNPGVGSVTVSQTDGTVFFGATVKFWAWNPSMGLNTLISAVHPGYNSTAVYSPEGRVYFGDYTTGPYWTWTQASGLSTVLSSGGNPGYLSTGVSPRDGRVYFGDETGGMFWTWQKSTGLSTILSGASVAFPGEDSSTTVSPVDGRAYFGAETASPINTDSFWSWAPPTDCTKLGY